MAPLNRPPASELATRSEPTTLPRTKHEADKDKENVDPNPKANKRVKVNRPRVAKGRLPRNVPSQPQPAPKSYLDRLPAELLVMIYEDLDSEEIAALRLQCKYLCQIATPYMFRDVKVIFKKTSVDNLVALSNHPVLSHNVKSINYEPNLVERMTRWSWEKSLPIMFHHDREDLPSPPKQSASQREWRLHERNLKKMVCDIKRKPYTQGQLDVAWPIYERYLQEQEDLIDRNWACQDLQHAIERFPNLEALYVNFSWGLWCGDPSANPYSDGICHAVPRSRHFWAIPGLEQIVPLMKMLGKSDVKLSSLRIGNLNWRFFEICGEENDKDENEDGIEDEEEGEGEDKGEDKDGNEHESEDGDWDEVSDSDSDDDLDNYEAGHLFKVMKGIVKSLQDIKLVITTWSDQYEDEDEGSFEADECYAFLQNGMLARLLANAPNLRKLAIAFDTLYARHACDLHYIVMDTHWPHLYTVKLNAIDTHEDDWINFFDRHTKTLKHINLGAIVLLDGDWVDVLERTQQLLTLEKAHFSKEIYSMAYDQMWQFDPPGLCSSKDDSVQENRTRWAMEEFMVQGGVCPLRDEKAHPQLQ
ncbi:MAG: hypothetical protein L6R41_007994 [Letrouitia leprolyta]|nr:MAG: hypothetical protein L6R41_007994 [Letrouitia leprolyta]